MWLILQIVLLVLWYTVLPTMPVWLVFAPLALMALFWVAAVAYGAAIEMYRR